MKITISRSFSAKKQIAPFEPIESFCAAQVEIEADDLMDKSLDRHSSILDDFCRAEVEKTLASEVNKRRTPDTKKIRDEAKTEAELDAGISDL
jgi:hypothetical protein